MNEFIRTCQECGHQQKDKKPAVGKMTPAYINRLCRLCKSPSMDYGSYPSPEEEEEY